MEDMESRGADGGGGAQIPGPLPITQLFLPLPSAPARVRLQGPGLACWAEEKRADGQGLSH